MYKVHLWLDGKRTVDFLLGCDNWTFSLAVTDVALLSEICRNGRFGCVCGAGVTCPRKLLRSTGTQPTKPTSSWRTRRKVWLSSWGTTHGERWRRLTERRVCDRPPTPNASVSTVITTTWIDRPCVDMDVILDWLGLWSYVSLDTE